MIQGSDSEAFRAAASQPSAGGSSGLHSRRGLRGGTPAPNRPESVSGALIDTTTPAVQKPRRDVSADPPAGIPAEAVSGRGIRVAHDSGKSTLIIGVFLSCTPHKAAQAHPDSPYCLGQAAARSPPHRWARRQQTLLQVFPRNL